MKRLGLVFLLATGLADAEGLTSRAEWLVYGTRATVDDESLFNPGNQIVRQPARSGSTELRPDFAWSDEQVALNLKPRVMLERSAQSNKNDLWLNEGKLRWLVHDDVTLAAGREILMWGPAQFWNPSNPFYADNGKTNVKRELFGKTFARARWQIADGWNVHVISQIDRGHFSSGANRIDSVKLDWVGYESSAAVLADAEPGKSPNGRGWAQWTVDDALLLYGEAAWARRSVLVPSTAQTATGWRVAPEEKGHVLDAVFGAAYTFPNSWTLNTEYYRHGSGYSAAELDNWNRLAMGARALTPINALASGQLGMALRPGTSPLQRNYVGVQLRNGNDEKIVWNLRYSRSLDDRSGQVVGQISYDLSDRWQLWGNAVIQHGDVRSEYGRWLESTVMVGMTVFLW